MSFIRLRLVLGMSQSGALLACSAKSIGYRCYSGNHPSPLIKCGYKPTDGSSSTAPFFRIHGFSSSIIPRDLCYVISKCPSGSLTAMGPLIQFTFEMRGYLQREWLILGDLPF